MNNSSNHEGGRNDGRMEGSKGWNWKRQEELKLVVNNIPTLRSLDPNSEDPKSEFPVSCIDSSVSVDRKGCEEK